MDSSVSLRHQKLLKCFVSLPEKILSLHGIDNMTEFVLHDLCDEDCFNLSKAAYFIDNPDFDCLKGIAGYDRAEDTVKMDQRWENPHHFTNHALRCAFNQKVRKIQRPSKIRQKQEDAHLVRQLASELSMTNPLFFTWTLKHQNHALFLYEPMTNDIKLEHDILRGASLLGFCPVF